MTQFEKLFHVMEKIWVIIPYALLVIMTYIFIDMPLAAYFHQLDLRTKIHALNILTAFGEWIAYIVLFFVAALYFRFIRVNSLYEARSWYLLGCVLVANLVCFVIKITLSRARPDLFFANHEFGFYWFKWSKYYWSFPSGHTTTVVSLAVAFGVLFPRCFYWVLTLALLLAATRVLLYHHYLSDVLTGFYLSFMVVGYFTQYLRKNKFFEKKIGCTILLPK